MNINSLCYLGLSLLSIILLGYVCYKKGVRRSLLLFLAMVGLGYFIEAVIYNFLGSYQYYPKLIKHNAIYDSNLGAIASNALALPVTATFIAAFHKNWLWIVFITGSFAGIEWLFLKLDIYTHNWWEIEYTSLGLPFYYLFAKILHKKIRLPLKGMIHSFCLFLIIGTFAGSFHIFPIMFFSNRYYELGLFENQAKDTTAFGAIFYLCASLFYVAIAKFHLMPRWLKYIVTALSMYTATILLRKTGILHSQVWWDTSYYILLSIAALLFAETISKQLAKGT
ncbi:hypothetical protein [Neobacillus drentensis]|uniref:hypothetical protein n=1 Tax=Neobacillus drentensis TaxID=220684 RepID=UPI002FFE90AF